MRQSFSLIPFPAEDTPSVTINGTAERQNNIFSVRYLLSGNLRAIFLPFPIINPCRKDDLWRTTCFEFFMASKDSPLYWEFNLSPSGEWNVYVMDAYRQVNLREESRIQRLQFKVQKDEEGFSLETELDVSPIIPETLPFEMGITSVIRANSGTNSYWALTHPHSEPDFHLRNSFVLEFPTPHKLLS